MNHAGEWKRDGFPLAVEDGGVGNLVTDHVTAREYSGDLPLPDLVGVSEPRLPKLAIVGSHPATREKAPYEDESFEIWLFNESAMKPEVYKRWDGLLQIHRAEVYTSLENWVNKGHWAWLQQDHGDGPHGRKRIFMQEADERVPNAVRYPLEEVLELIPYRYLRSSPAMALGLAIWMGYTEIWLYGSELSSNTEYTYQAINLAFWIGFTHGLGIELHLECWQNEFEQPVYGYEGEAQIERWYFEKRYEEYKQAWETNRKQLKAAQDRLDRAMIENKFDQVGNLTEEVRMMALATGETAAVMGEAERYLKRTDDISRQEFERVSAQAQLDAEKFREQMYHAGGKCEYVWNVWRQSARNEALQQLRAFTKEKTESAFNLGARIGVHQENIRCMGEYDKAVTALGGQRAVHQVQNSK